MKKDKKRIKQERSVHARGKDIDVSGIGSEATGGNEFVCSTTGVAVGGGERRERKGRNQWGVKKILTKRQ